LLDIVIVNWNSGDRLRTCVNSILNNGKEELAQIIIIDNDSTDGSDKTLDKLPLVSLIRLPENVGFAKACNIGAKHSKAEFLLFLNPDTEIFENTLYTAVDFMNAKENAQVGICGVQLVDKIGIPNRTCTYCPSFLQFLFHTIGISRIIPSSGYVMRDWSHRSVRQVDHVIGAFFLVRQSLFHELAGFDERFFVYFEDLDFSFRAKKNGWKTMYLASAQAFHEEGGCSSQVKSKRLFYSLRSRLLYGFKHFSVFHGWVLVFSTLCIEPLVRLIGLVLKGNWRGIEYLVNGLYLLIKKIPHDYRMYWRRGRD